jgi:hypothetical protein
MFEILDPPLLAGSALHPASAHVRASRQQGNRRGQARGWRRRQRRRHARAGWRQRHLPQRQGPCPAAENNIPTVYLFDVIDGNVVNIIKGVFSCKVFEVL